MYNFLCLFLCFYIGVMINSNRLYRCIYSFLIIIFFYFEAVLLAVSMFYLFVKWKNICQYQNKTSNQIIPPLIRISSFLNYPKSIRISINIDMSPSSTDFSFRAKYHYLPDNNHIVQR